MDNGYEPLIRVGRWHPKVTPYRLLVTGLTVGLGTAKAIASAPGGDSALAVILEWMIGVVFLLLTFFLNKYEASEDAKPTWFFKGDVVSYIRAIGIPIPLYDSEDRPLDLVVKHKELLITGYRILVSASAVSFGLVKAALSYRGFTTTPRVVDWVYGIIVTVSLYWLGMYENSDTEVPILSWFFVEDLCKGATFVSTIIFTTPHLAALCATHWVTTFCFTYAKGLHLENNPDYEGKLFGEASFYCALVSFVATGIGIGVIPSVVIVISLGSPLAQRVSSLFNRTSGSDPEEEAAVAMDSVDSRSTSSWFLRRTFIPFLITSPGGWTVAVKTLTTLLIVAIAVAVYLLVLDAEPLLYAIAAGWTVSWLLSMRSLWAQLNSPEDDYGEGMGDAFDLWEVLGYAVFTLFFAQVGYLLLLALFMLPMVLMLFLVVWCTSN